LLLFCSDGVGAMLIRPGNSKWRSLEWLSGHLPFEVLIGVFTHLVAPALATTASTDARASRLKSKTKPPPSQMQNGNGTECLQLPKTLN